MKRQVLLDTGPLVALLDRDDAHHAWASEQWARVAPPLLTCEAVLSEACFLLRDFAPGPEGVFEAVRRGAVEVPFRLADHADLAGQLMAKYSQIPMSLADACLVCMAEIHPESTVFTMDRDFPDLSQAWPSGDPRSYAGRVVEGDSLTGPMALCRGSASSCHLRVMPVLSLDRMPRCDKLQ